MAALGKKLRTVQAPHGGQALMFWCPGCNEGHVIQIGDRPGPRWSYIGGPDRPTFRPSVKVQSGHYASAYEGKGCWCDYERETGKPAPFKCRRCHLWVTDGQIQFLPDSTHHLSGQTVELPDWPQITDMA